MCSNQCSAGRGSGYGEKVPENYYFDLRSDPDLDPDPFFLAELDTDPWGNISDFHHTWSNTHTKLESGDRVSTAHSSEGSYTE